VDATVRHVSSHGLTLQQTRPIALGRRAGLAAAAYAFAVVMLGTTLPTPLYAIYQRELGFSELMVTVIFAIYAAGVIAALVLFGRLSDQLGRRHVLLSGLALSVLSAIAFLLAHSVGLLFVGRVLSGLSAGIFTGTATAALVDLAGPNARGRATLVATMVNTGGLASGPLLAGLLAQFAGSPTRLTFWVDVALLLPALLLVWLMPETVEHRGRAQLRPRLPRVPPQARAAFVRAALAGFAGFAVLGLFTAVAPGFLAQILGIKSPAVVGLVVFTVFISSMLAQTALRRVPVGVALPAGCAALIGGMAVLALGLALSSLAGLVAGGVIAAIGQGLSFRAGLASVTEAAPEHQRAETASAFFIVAYVAISVPVVGVGVLANLTSLRPAGLIFAAMVAAIALAALLLLARRPATRS
jgi:predicted MFS family arabinose efflux permease